MSGERQVAAIPDHVIREICADVSRELMRTARWEPGSGNTVNIVIDEERGRQMLRERLGAP